MGLNALYKKYFQKSKIFMYPLLDIKRGTVIVPTETYVSWNYYSSEDAKLICVYDTSIAIEYVNFENNVLFKHNRLVEYVKVDENTSIFIFDFSDLKEDWDHFINGRYSRIKEDTKRKIVNYFSKSSANYRYVESYLFPEKYREDYAKLLNADISLIEETIELCDKPDLTKETLLIKVPDLEKLKILD